MRRMFERRTYQKLKEDRVRSNPLKKNHQKIAIFGPSASGKTRLSCALTGDPSAKTQETIGSTYFRGGSIKTAFLDFWDIGGSERFETLWPMYLRSSDQVVLTFDSSDPKSFAQLDKYCVKIQEHAPKAEIVLVGMNPKPDEAPKVSEELVKKFMKKYNIHSYKIIDAGAELKVEDLQNLLIENSQPKIQEESKNVVEAKQLAKDSIDFLRDVAYSNEEYTDTVLHICKILEDALVSENMNYYMAFNRDLLADELECLRYAPSSLYSTARNTVATVLVCCAILATAFIALHWLNEVLKENYAQKGDYFLFSTSGAKQQAQEAQHKTESVIRQKKG